LEFNIPALFVSFLYNQIVSCDYFGCGGRLKRKEVGLQFWLILCRPKNITAVAAAVISEENGNIILAVTQKLISSYSLRIRRPID
jgi:hypothetical protein